MTSSPFAARIHEGLKHGGLTLRGLCRAARLDPSFFSKVLSGKRNPPEEEVLRRIAAVLELDAAELIVSAGRIPEEWRALRADQDLFRRMDALATQRQKSGARTQWEVEMDRNRVEAVSVETVKTVSSSRAVLLPPHPHLAEELL